MRREKGSALMITILIVFVTVTIGSALASFVIYNYKLREVDNRVGRAEYEAEKIVDELQIEIKTKYKEVIADARNNAESAVNADIKKGSYRQGINGLLDTTAINEALQSTFESGLEENISELDLTKFGDDLTIRSSINSIDSDKNIVNEITVEYGSKPVIKLSVEFVLKVPEFDTIQGDYDIDKLVFIRNFTMQDWGYL